MPIADMMDCVIVGLDALSCFSRDCCTDLASFSTSLLILGMFWSPARMREIKVCLNKLSSFK
jgi:hypothetical protein